jgi:hypothetical protein
MDERQKFYDSLKHYRGLPDLATGEATLQAIEIMIRERRAPRTARERALRSRLGVDPLSPKGR